MADQTKTILLDVQINQSDANKQLVATEKNLLELKKAQADLTKEYKAGKITQDQYVESNLKLQRAITKENDQKRTLTKLISTESNSRDALKLKVSQLTKEYDNLNTKTAEGAKRADQLQKELTQLNAEITKSSKSAGLFKDQIGNYPDQFNKIGSSIATATNEVQPFGVSVQGATASMAKFVTPAGAALGVLSLLGAAYASSATGARDLEFASNQLSAATGILSNRFAELITSADTPEGEGFFSQLTFAALAYLDTSLAVEARVKALAQEQIKNLEISRAFAQGAAKEDERRAEQARRIRDDENASLDERLQKSKEIDAILSQSAQRSTIVIQAQINAIKQSTTAYEKNREAQLQVAQLEAEISDKQEEITGKLTENVTARRAILKLAQEQRDLDAAVARADQRLGIAPGGIIKPIERQGETAEEIVEAQNTQKLITQALFDEGQIRFNINEKMNADLLKANEQFYKEDAAAKQHSVELKAKSDQAALQVTSNVLGAATSLFEQNTEEYKVLATAQTLIDTYVGAQRSYNALAGIVPAGPALGAAAAAAAIIAGLARVAAINDVQFAEGGWTGPGSKYQPAGVVHANEYVVPAHIVNSPAAQPHLAAMESMRTGFADGGFVPSQMANPYQMAQITANAIKNMPAPIVSWTEGRIIGRRVEVREQISKR